MHYIFVVVGSIDRFDPPTDLLVEEDAFLTWRRWDQDLPNSKHTRIYCSVSGRGYDGRWFIHPAGAQRGVYSGIDQWLDRTAVSSFNGRLGMYKRSEFYGLLAPIEASWGARRMVFNEKVELLSRLTKEISFPRSFPFEPRPIEPEMEWDRLRKEIVSQLLSMQIAA